MILFNKRSRFGSVAMLDTTAFKCTISTALGLFKSSTLVLSVGPDGTIGRPLAKAYHKRMSKAQREAVHDRIISLIDAGGSMPLPFAAAGSFSVAKREGLITGFIVDERFARAEWQARVWQKVDDVIERFTPEIDPTKLSAEDRVNLADRIQEAGGQIEIGGKLWGVKDGEIVPLEEGWVDAEDGGYEEGPQGRSDRLTRELAAEKQAALEGARAIIKPLTFVTAAIVFALCFWRYSLGFPVSIGAALITFPAAGLGVEFPIGYILGKRAARRLKVRIRNDPIGELKDEQLARIVDHL
jgi:hypothetical protein